MPVPLNIDQAIERLYALGVGVIGTGANQHERPHKPLLLLAVMDLIAQGLASAELVVWSQELRARFSAYFEVVRLRDDQDSPENPFFYLGSEGFWEPVQRGVDGSERPLEATPTVAQAKVGTVWARFTQGMEVLVSMPGSRWRLREALVARYFPKCRPRVVALFIESGADVGPLSVEPASESDRLQEVAGDVAPLPGRDAAFRRLVLAAYDFQCAACGLRIKLPGSSLSFVDGAHLIPFGESRNDHPTNGIALCKNHHWAMDWFLLVPTPDGVWRASRRLDERRSDGERSLVELDGKPLLQPHDEAFRPDRGALEWRAERLA